MENENKIDVIEKRKMKNTELKESGVNLYPNDFSVTHTVRDIVDCIQGFPEDKDQDDEVVVLAGKDRGKRGTIVRVFSDDRVVVENVNMV